MQTRRVLIVDDHPGLWLGLKLRVRADGRFEPVGPAHTLADAIAKAAGCDAVVLDLNLPDIRGPQTAREFRRAHPNMPLVLYTGDALAGDVADLADATVRKGLLDELVDTLAQVTGAPARPG